MLPNSSLGFERWETSRERFKPPDLSYDLGVLSQRSHADSEICRVVPDEEVRIFNVHISSAREILGILDHLLATSTEKLCSKMIY